MLLKKIFQQMGFAAIEAFAVKYGIISFNFIDENKRLSKFPENFRAQMVTPKAYDAIANTFVSRILER